MIGSVAGMAARLSLLATLLVAGGHSVYYLYYWEWVRAQIALTAFVAALVVGATTLVLRRIDRAERAIIGRLEGLAAAPPDPGRAAPAAAPGTTEPDFPWLAPSFGPGRDVVAGPVLLAAAGISVAAPQPPRSAVFIPVLLGAGLLVSVLAGLVERAATRLRAGAVPRRTAPAARVVAVAVVAGLLAGGLWSTSHYRTSESVAGHTELLVDVDSKSVPAPPEETVGTVARYCARNAIAGVDVRAVSPDPPDRALLVVSPALDEQARRRFGGCLEDAVLFRHRLEVVHVTVVPAGTTARRDAR